VPASLIGAPLHDNCFINSSAGSIRRSTVDQQLLFQGGDTGVRR